MKTEKQNIMSAPFQARVISVAMVMLSLIIIGVFSVGVFLILRWTADYLSDMLWPLAVSGIIALLLRPFVLLMQKKLVKRRLAAIFLIYLAGLVFMLILAALILPVMIQQAGSFIEYFPALLERAITFAGQYFPDSTGWVRDHLSSEAVEQHLGKLSEHAREILETSMPALSSMGEFLTSTFILFAGLFMIPVYLFFFLLMDKNPLQALRNELTFIPEKIREDLIYLAQEFASIILAFFRGQVIIAMIMGLLMAVGFSLAGLQFGAFIGLMIGLLNIIPYFGSIVGLLVAIPLSYFQDGGGMILLLLTLGVFAAVQLIEGYFLTPKIMGRSTGLHPLTIIISIFFWGKVLNGILGMVLAIPLTAFFVVAWRLIRKNYLDPSGSTSTAAS
ncbi:MAG: AI-2E family transporter [Desulfonatronovibrio sp.]